MEQSHTKHPNYLGVFIALGILTGLEVLAAINIPETIRIPILLFLAFCKAALVALYYMHLRFDSRLFAFFFAAAIFLLAIPFSIVLLIVQTPFQPLVSR